MRKKNYGFTLIELLVVISVIGLLAALIMVNFNAARERARDVQRKSDLDQIKKALRMYYNDKNSYPAGTDKICGCTEPVCTTFAWGQGSFKCGDMVYMKLLPQDPAYQADIGIPTYKYQEITGYQDFCLWATLENKSDGNITSSHTRCQANCKSIFTNDNYVVCAD